MKLNNFLQRTETVKPQRKIYSLENESKDVKHKQEIEELKDELCTIVLTRTGTGVNGRDRWDTPELVEPNGKKGRMRKDRYSSLVMANMVAREIHRATNPIRFGIAGGFSKDLANQGSAPQQLYQGPAWFTNQVGDGSCFRVIKRHSR